MLLRHITLHGVRCFRNPLSIGAFSDGLNLIFAPNESGKSTLIEAIARALFDRYTVSGDKIDGLRPWGTRLAPEVEIAFETETTAYRLRKRFLNDQISELYEVTDGAPVLLAQRDQADDFTRELMAGEMPGRGPSQGKHWGIARALWCLQGPGSEATLDVPDAVAQQLHRALPGSNLAGQSAAAELQTRLDRQYTVFFTETGRTKTHSPLQQLQQDITELDAQCRRMREAYDAAQHAAEAMAQIAYDLRDLQVEKARYQDNIAAYEQDAAGVGQLRARIETLQQTLAQRTSDFEKLAHNLKHYESTAQQLREREPQLAQLAGQVECAVTDRKAADTLWQEARQEYETAQQARRQADDARRHGRKRNEARQLAQHIGALGLQLQEVETLTATVRQREQALRATPCPTADEVANVQRYQQEIATLQAQLSAVGLAATITFEQDAKLTVQDGEGSPAVVEGLAGEAHTVNAGVELGFALPGLLYVRVTSGAREPAALAEQLRQTEEARQAVLVRYAAANDADLVRTQLAWEALERQVDDLRGQLARALRPHRSPDALRDAIAEETRTLTSRCHELQLAVDAVSALAPVDEEALEAAYTTAEAEEGRLQTILASRRERLEACIAEEERLLTAQRTLRHDIERDSAILDTVLNSVECRDANALRARVGAHEAALQALQGELADAQAHLPDPAADPESLLQTARDACADVEERERDLERRLLSRQLEIDLAQSEGRYEKLAAFEEELDNRRREYARLEMEAQAVKLLRQVLRERREAMVTGQLPGLENAVTRMLRAITGRERHIALDSDFTVSGIVDRTAAVPHAPSALSAGTREQLDLALRIALGEAYAAQYGRTMMVLDDALLYTDPARHDRVKEILKIAAQRLQIFILTSHPERYRGIIPRDYQFDLAQLATAHTPITTGALVTA